MSKTNDLDPLLPHTERTPDVPVFDCIVYLSINDTGGVRARVGNLPDLQCTASSEREALMKLIPVFKQKVADWTARQVPIPWIDPPTAAESTEQVRYVPVHL